jgi:hypothetical protein
VWVPFLYRYASVPLPTLLPWAELNVPVVLNRDLEHWIWTVEKKQGYRGATTEALMAEWRDFSMSGHASVGAWLREARPHAPQFGGHSYAVDGSPPFPTARPS